MERPISETKFLHKEENASELQQRLNCFSDLLRTTSTIYSKKEKANIIGVNSTTLDGWEKCAFLPGPDVNLDLVAQAYGISTEELKNAISISRVARNEVKSVRKSSTFPAKPKKTPSGAFYIAGRGKNGPTHKHPESQ